jgi:hypothetical protein
MDVAAPNNDPIQCCLTYFGHIKQITERDITVYQLQLLLPQRRFKSLTVYGPKRNIARHERHAASVCLHRYWQVTVGNLQSYIRMNIRTLRGYRHFHPE